MHLQVHLLPKEGVNKSEISSDFRIYQSMTIGTAHCSKCLCQVQMPPCSKQMQVREVPRTIESHSSVPWAGALVVW